MTNPLIGRKAEQAILQAALQSSEAEMISVIGRRRVGKTFLVKSTYQEKIAFEITGIQHAPLKEQLQNFTFQLNKVANNNSLPIPTIKNWMEAFLLLIKYLEIAAQQATSKKKIIKQVVFFDELPWLATRKSGFLRALGFFWNSWAVHQPIVVVICGSAASWMIQKVVNHKGGLHNRITKRIHLQAFSLAETATFLQSKNVQLNNYQITQLYMAMGGIPHYLKEVQKGKSAAQNIDHICFSETGLLKNEFKRLYHALFEQADNHIAIIRTLAKKRQSLTRKEIIQLAKLPNGGGTTKVLEELVHSGFIHPYYYFNKKKKEKYYRLTDEYSLFYLQFMEKTVHDGAGTWQQIHQTQTYKTWSGYAFENICLKHVPQIKNALGIKSIYTLSSTFTKQGNKKEKGTQINLVLDRSDQVINLFEIKFYNTTFSIDKSYANKLNHKMRVFQESTNTKKQLFLVLISTFGIQANQYSLGLISQSLTLNDLFE